MVSAPSVKGSKLENLGGPQVSETPGTEEKETEPKVQDE